MSRPVFAAIASKFEAWLNCDTNDDQNARVVAWLERHFDAIEQLCKEFLPHGSGFDNGTQFDFDKSRKDKLVFNTAYHHMNDGGYVKWTEHTVTITPSFDGFDIKVGGRDYNDIKGLITDEFVNALRRRIDNEVFNLETEEYTYTIVA